MHYVKSVGDIEDLQVNSKVFPMCTTCKYIPVASIQKSYNIAGSYFPMSKGNRVRLYQDAHCSAPQTVPHFSQMQLPPGYISFSSDPINSPFYHPASCWKDLYEAIQVYLELHNLGG